MGSILSDGTGIDAVDRNVEKIWKQKEHNTIRTNRQVGSKFNGWRNPVSEFARNEVNLAYRLQENVHIGKYDIQDKLWQKSCGVVDEITRFFHITLKKVTSMCYPSLNFEDFVKQGSSREGLKIRQPDEFDMILPFTIEGIDIQAVPALNKDGELIPEFMKLRISDNSHSHAMNDSRYESLRKEGVFEKCGSDLFLNAMCFQMHVISSIMDTTIAYIQKVIDAKNRHQTCSFTLSKTRVFPPTYRFKITIKSDADFDEMSHVQGIIVHLQAACTVTSNIADATSVWNTKHKVIEFDIVPGLLLQTDSVPNPDSWCFFSMKCHRYAVMKWVHKGRYADEYPEPNLLWRESSCGYEKHILDVSSRNKSDVYILTACRIFKAYVDGLGNSSQLCSLLSSYHIKNIAIHCILLQLHASGVKEALGYLIAFLEIGLEKEFLPHFFYGNPNISKTFSKLSANANQICLFPYGEKSCRNIRVNLFRKIPHDHFPQALLSLKMMKTDLHGLFTERSHLGNLQKIDSFRNLCMMYVEERISICPLM